MIPDSLLDRIVAGVRRPPWITPWARGEPDELAGRGTAVGVYFLALSLLTLYPLFRPGYVLALDMVFAPNMHHVEYVLRAKDPLYYGRLPVALVLDGFAVVVPQWIVQRAVFVAIVAGSGLSMYAACRDRTTAGALFAGTLYAVNPFVYVRLLVGHWWFLLGYVVLPLAVVSFADALSDRRHVLRAAGWTAVACAFDPHVAVLAAVAFAGLGVVTVVRSSRPRSVLANAGRFGAVTATFSAYWLLPAVATVVAGTSKVATMNALDLIAFSPRGAIAGNVPLSVAMLFGFWRGGYRLPTELIPLPLYLLAFVVVLYLATAGWYRRRGAPFETGLVVVGMLGFVLALGVSVDATTPPFRFLYEHVPVFRGMRDSQKFVALLALAYAFLGARGVDRIGAGDVLGEARLPTVRWLSSLPGLSASDPPGARSARATGTDARTVLVCALVATTLVYAWPMFGGFSGQLSATDYPDGWAAADDHLTEDPATFRVLFLPWHQYLTFPWTDGTVANPADAYFERPVIRGQSIDLAGIETQAASPTHERVSGILADPASSEPTGSELSPLGVKYVVVAKAADYRQYDYLQQQPDLVLVEENGDLVLFENRAFEESPPSDRWPRAWPAVPWGSLLVGAAITSSTVLLAFVRSPHRRRAIAALDSIRSRSLR